MLVFTDLRNNPVLITVGYIVSIFVDINGMVNVKTTDSVHQIKESMEDVMSLLGFGEVPFDPCEKCQCECEECENKEEKEKKIN